MHTDVTAMQHDHLTGLANRALFDSQAQYALDTARQNASRFGLALIDLDGFKPINAAGDKVLVEIARRLSSAATATAMVARLGGDEFGVVTWLGRDEVALGRLARKIGLAFKQPYLVGGSKCYLSASIGTALYPVDGETLEHLLKSADGRMYGLKRATKSRHEKWMAWAREALSTRAMSSQSAQVRYFSVPFPSGPNVWKLPVSNAKPTSLGRAHTSGWC